MDKLQVGYGDISDIARFLGRREVIGQQHDVVAPELERRLVGDHEDEKSGT